MNQIAQASDEFDSLLKREIHYFIELKRLYRFEMKLIDLCKGRLIKNDLIYTQLLFAAIDGLFLRLDNFHVRLIDTLETFKQKYLDKFKKNNKRGFDESQRKAIYLSFDGDDKIPKDAPNFFAQRLKDAFDIEYDKLFPRVKERKQGRPNHEDFDLIKANLREVFQPIRNHRDTVVAHWDKEQIFATINDLDNAMVFLETLLGRIYHVSKLGQQSFELGGYAANIEGTAIELANLILGTFRGRRAHEGDMIDVYLMGYDTWGGAREKEEYLKACETSNKYTNGTWYVLEDSNGNLVSSLIAYDSGSCKGKPIACLSSIATDPKFRYQGHAGRLIYDVMRLHPGLSTGGLSYLWSPKCKRWPGFVPASERWQTKTEVTLMVKGTSEVLDSFIEDEKFEISYFGNEP